MQIHRLRLLNFRQHADTRLELDRGLTGIIGPNGAGKTTLLEAIAWAMYGQPAARGTRENLRRRSAPPRSRVEVELEFTLGAHRYRILRTLSQAELFQDGDPAPIANSLATVTERVTRLLGMSRDEFFSTYFTGQKELAIMAQMSAPERAQFLGRVLGYERLRTAQQRLKERRRATQVALESRESELIDPQRLDEEDALAAEALRSAEEASARLAAGLRDADAALAALRPEVERWEALQQQVLSLEGDLKVAEHAAVTAREEFGRLDRELAEALGAKTRLDLLAPELAEVPALRAARDAMEAQREAASGRRSVEARLDEVRGRLTRLAERLAQLPQPEAIAAAASAGAEAQALLTRLTEETEARRTAWVREKQDAETQRKHLLDQHADLKEQRRRLEEAGPDGICPTCSRPLGAEFDNVLGVLVRQVEEVEFQGKYYRQRIEQLQKEPADLAALTRQRDLAEQEVRRLSEQAGELAQQAAERGRLEAEGVSATAQREELERTVAQAPEQYDEPRHLALRSRLDALEPRVLEAERLRAVADRALTLVPRAAVAEQELSKRESRARELREQLAALGWSAEGFEATRARQRAAEQASRAAAVGTARAAGELTAALARRAETTRRRGDAERRAAEVRRLGDLVAMHTELDRALGDLRTDLNNALRPDLSEAASRFLSDLTSGRYTDFELDEDYVATIVDDGIPQPVISGGEEDIANLALRLAISQMIAERAGQPLSLLVLDEIFGSLDEDRRGAVLDLLRNLADRFPQVILITHLETVRDGFDRVVRLRYDVEEGVARVVEDAVTEPGEGGARDAA